MSGSARLEFLSDHRPAYAADGIVLMNLALAGGELLPDTVVTGNEIRFRVEAFE
jgi:hypothetical protein